MSCCGGADLMRFDVQSFPRRDEVVRLDSAPPAHRQDAPGGASPRLQPPRFPPHDNCGGIPSQELLCRVLIRTDWLFNIYLPCGIVWIRVSVFYKEGATKSRF